ncbi:hypothetical protein ACR6HW_17305 [Fusibacter sp. JL298sf-3]
MHLTTTEKNRRNGSVCGGFFMAGAAVYALATGIGKLIRRP